MPFKDIQKRKEYSKEYLKKYRKTDIGSLKYKLWDRKHDLKKHNLTIEQYEVMSKLQSNLCAICSKPEQRLHYNGNATRLAVDHNHLTGIGRGLLCSRCNISIGKFEDNPKLLRKAADYLEVH